MRNLSKHALESGSYRRDSTRLVCPHALKHGRIALLPDVGIYTYLLTYVEP